MRRLSACAASGIALFGMAACSLPPGGAMRSTSLDLRWMHSGSKQDRLSLTRPNASDETITITLPAEGTTIVARRPWSPQSGAAIEAPPVKVRTISFRPPQETPKAHVKAHEKPLEGCEPAFSPVTAPALAHISSVCDS